MTGPRQPRPPRYLKELPPLVALRYAELGYRVLPLHAVKGERCSCGRSAEQTAKHRPGKHPRTRHGVKDATADLVQVEAWWQQWPGANVGIATGGGLVVFDVDHRSGGAATWDAALARHYMPAAPFVVTGGGLHVYMRDPTGKLRPGREPLGPGVDVQGPGRYVVAPPSIHPNGRRYTWVKAAPLVPVAELPAIPPSLLAALNPPPPAPKPQTVRVVPFRSSGMNRYGRTALDGLVADVCNAAPGTRHGTLFRCAARAGQLARERGCFQPVEAFDALFPAGQAVYRDEVTDHEIARVVADGIKRGMQGGAA